MISRSDERMQTKPGLGRSRSDEAEEAGESPSFEASEDESTESTSRGKRMSSDKIEGTDVADEMDEGPARKVEKGRETPEGEPAEIEGAHQGSGSGGEPAHRNTLGHGEREATISGAHQGQHGGTKR